MTDKVRRLDAARPPEQTTDDFVSRECSVIGDADAAVQGAPRARRKSRRRNPSRVPLRPVPKQPPQTDREPKPKAKPSTEEPAPPSWWFDEDIY